MSGPLPNEDRRTLDGAGGTPLRLLIWPVERPRGRIQLLHGLSEHMGRYRELAGMLNAAGYAAFGHDHRGHGESGGRRGVVGRFPDLVQDVATARAAGLAALDGEGDPGLVAHSLGGLVALRALQLAARDGGSTPYRGAVISAPWLDTAAEIPLLTRLALPVLRRVAPDFPVPQPLKPENLTRDAEKARAYREDPKVVRALAVSFFDQVRAVQEEVRATPAPPDLPMVVLIPGDDRLASAEETRRWIERAGPNVTSWMLPETRHEPFNDLGRNDIFERLVDWLNPLFEPDEEDR